MRGGFHFLLPSVALALTTATQLRFPGFPLGLGECLLACWLLIAGQAIRKSGSSFWSSMTAVAFAAFWLVALVSMGLGAILGGQSNQSLATSSAHDALAYGLALAFCLGLVLHPQAGRQAMRLTYFLTLAAALPMVVLWIYGLFREWLGPMNLWYGLRFTGWSANPNQAALLLLTMPFLILHRLEVRRRASVENRYLAWALLVCLVLVIGWSTDSGALRLAWTASFSLLLAVFAWRARLGRPYAPRLLSTLCLMIVLAGMIQRAAEESPVRSSQAEQVRLAEDLSKGLDPSKTVRFLGLRTSESGNLAYAMLSMSHMYYQDDELTIRANLVVNGLRAIQASPVFGLGPGCHSGLDEPFQGSEAHNTLVDWGTNAGVVGMLALLGLVAWLARRLLLTGHYSLLAGLLALAVFAQFHHVLRHPMTWAYLALASLLADVSAARRVSAREADQARGYGAAVVDASGRRSP